MAADFNPEGGTLNYRFSTYDDVSGLSNAVRLVRGMQRPRTGCFFRAETFFNVATQAEEYRDLDDPADFYARYGGRPLHEQSHGESFLAFLTGDARPGLYLLDEPEAALSPQRQLTLLARIVDMARDGSQFIIASHSPILLGTPGAQIFSFDDGRIREIAYEETESYQVTELFINNREGLLRQLL